jgi:hypothetical protein
MDPIIPESQTQYAQNSILITIQRPRFHFKKKLSEPVNNSHILSLLRGFQTVILPLAWISEGGNEQNVSQSIIDIEK